MPRTSFFETHFGRPLNEFLALNHEQRAGSVRSAVPDLHLFFDEGRPLDQRDAPERTRALATSLFQAMSGIERHGPTDEAAAATLRERIVTDAWLRSEHDRDQNVYLGKLFTRVLTRAVPDLVFQPASLGEAVEVFRWSRANRVPLTLRGAGSTAMGGSVPNDGGVTLDLARLDLIDTAADTTCVVGAGARLRHVHERLAQRGLALKVYPSNLGGTLVGWFVSGGIGLNAFGHGRALGSVIAADVVLPTGEHVRFHADGRVDAPGGGLQRTTYSGTAADGWFRNKGYPRLVLSDFAGSEGTLGLVLQLTVAVERRTELGAFLLSFANRSGAIAALNWIARAGGKELPAPANLKLYSGSHMHHTRRVWEDEDARGGRDGALAGGAHLPWTRIAGPAELGVTPQPDRAHAGAYLLVDFLGLDAAKTFAQKLAHCPGEPVVLGEESVRVAGERFRPQQTKRFGPGLLAAEILVPTEKLGEFLTAADTHAAAACVTLDSEAYVLADGWSLAITSYLTDHRAGTFAVDLGVAPALTDLAMRRFGGKPYVLGRWLSPFYRRSRAAKPDKLRQARAALDPQSLVGTGVVTGLKLRGALGALLTATFLPGVGMLRSALGSSAMSWTVRAARRVLGHARGPAAGRGEPARVGDRYSVMPALASPEASERPIEANGEPQSILLAIPPSAALRRDEPLNPIAASAPQDRALHCVNCGECNSVCPIFHESKIRLPQMLTHIGEMVRAGEAMPQTGSVLLDLCMRCGNCEEVCQAGIPHLPLYEVEQRRSDAARPRDVERHTAIVAALRSSPRYRRDFLDVRGGMYLRRSPASLPGLTRFVVLRSENDAGAASTCIHCGACVPVCPTHANREFEAADPRWITTVQSRCIGCGSCVEVCPANHTNGGRTLRVMEAPTGQWFEALAEFEQTQLVRVPEPGAVVVVAAPAGEPGHSTVGAAEGASS